MVEILWRKNEKTGLWVKIKKYKSGKTKILGVAKKKGGRLIKKKKEDDGRPTIENGKLVMLPRRGYVYLGRDVKDVGKKGLDSLKEVKGILREMEKDAKHGISLKTINARTRTLFLAVLHDSDFSEKEKEKAVKMINKFRKKFGWKPFEIKKPLK